MLNSNSIKYKLKLRKHAVKCKECYRMVYVLVYCLVYLLEHVLVEFDEAAKARLLLRWHGGYGWPQKGAEIETYSIISSKYN